MESQRQRTMSSISHSSKKSKYKSLIQLRNDISLIEGVSIIIGVIVGSGIFVSPVGVLKYTNSVGLSFIMWLISGLFSATGALVWAELGTTIPLSGGEYIYILKVFGPMPAFLCLWISFILIGSVATAANSMIFSQYILQPFFGECLIPSHVLILTSMFGMLTLGAINCYNVQWATKIAVVFTVCKIGALLLIIIIGGVYLFKGRTDSFIEPFAYSDPKQTFSSASLAMAFYQGFWAFSGWNYLNFLTNEMKNPVRNLPLAIGISLTTITALYVLVNVAYLAVLSPQEMLIIGKSSAAIAVNFANETMGVMSWIMPIFVGCSVFGSMNSELLSLSRLTHTGAEENHMPKVLAMVSYKHLTPMPAVIIITLLTIIFQMYQDAFYLIELTGFAFSVIAAIAVSCLLYLRYKEPELPRPFKLPIIIPVLFLMADIFLGAITIHQQPYDSLITVGLMFLSIPIYIVFISWQNKPKSMVAVISKITLYIQKLLNVVLQDLPFDELVPLPSKESSKINLGSNGIEKSNNPV